MRSQKPVLLALDTSTFAAGLSLYDGAEVLCEFTWISQDHHTVDLGPAIAEAFTKTGLSTAALAVVAVARGPGSFTGLRIGLAAAKGLALARRIPIIAIPTLDFLAASQPPGSYPLVALLRAGRGRLAAAWYRWVDHEWKAGELLEVLTTIELIARLNDPTVVCGELTAEERLMLKRDCPNAILSSPAQSLRRPAFLAELAWSRWQNGESDDPSSLAPLYLHYNGPIAE